MHQATPKLQHMPATSSTFQVCFRPAQSALTNFPAKRSSFNYMCKQQFRRPHRQQPLTKGHVSAASEDCAFARVFASSRTLLQRRTPLHLISQDFQELEDTVMSAAVSALVQAGVTSMLPTARYRNICTLSSILQFVLL